MCYLWGTWILPLTLKSTGVDHTCFWVDATFAVHEDMKSHTGGPMTLGKGIVYSTSTHQCLTTCRSTDGELVGVYDIAPQVLWACYFIEAQGYKVTNSTVYQDNQGAILLANYGRIQE
jgi:hypothetical protein